MACEAGVSAEGELMQDIVINKNSPVLFADKSEAGNSSAWLKELESAQWQQRQRYQPSENPEQRILSDNSSTHAQDPMRFSRQTPLGEKKNSLEKILSQENAASAGRMKENNNELAFRSLARSGPAHLIANANASVLSKMLAMNEEQQAALRRNPRLFLKTTWQSQHTHAILEAEEVKVWLRDSVYEQGEGRRLLRKLQVHFSRLGLRLTQFTLNGLIVSDSASPAQE